jgi:hypothetical protein
MSSPGRVSCQGERLSGRASRESIHAAQLFVRVYDRLSLLIGEHVIAIPWFDRAGNFHSEALHVVERYTRTGPDHLSYEVTIEDPKVFTRPWKMSMPLYRRKEKNAQLFEFKCVEFAEELMYGHLRKKNP